MIERKRVHLEDLLKHVDNKYRLVIAVAKRARQLNEGAKSLLNFKGKSIEIALSEISEGKLDIGHTEKGR